MDPTDPGFGDLPPFMYVAFVIFGVFFVIAVAFGVTTAVRSRKVLRDNGLDPLAAQAQLAVRLAQGPMGTPATSLEQRLTELDDLHRRGLITDDEHGAARRAALGGHP
jgi:hypothetical protein